VSLLAAEKKRDFETQAFYEGLYPPVIVLKSLIDISSGACVKIFLFFTTDLVKTEDQALKYRGTCFFSVIQLVLF